MSFNYVGFWFVIVRYFVLLSNYVTLGLQKHVFLINSDIRHFFALSNYVWKFRYSYVTFWFVNLLYVFLRQNYIIDAFLTMTYFSWPLDYVSCGKFILRMEITLQLCFIFVRHCEVYFITSQLCYLLFQCSYIFLWRQNYVIFWFFRITCGCNVEITFRFCLSLWRSFYYVAMTLFICSM